MEGVRALYAAYWLVIGGGLVLYLAVALSVE